MYSAPAPVARAVPSRWPNPDLVPLASVTRVDAIELCYLRCWKHQQESLAEST